MSKRVVRIQSFLAKIEATEGTDPTLAATNAIRLAGPMQITDGAEFMNLREDAISEGLGPLSPLVPAGKFVELVFGVHLRGYGSAYSASNLPEVDALLRACGLSQTVVTTGGSESVTYELRDTGQESCYCKFYLDGMLRAVAGCRGTVALEAPAGQPMTARFTLRGIYVAPSDTSLLAGTYQSTVPPNFAAASALAINGVTSLIGRRFTTELGNTIAARANANGTDGLAGFHITRRVPKATVQVEAPLAATFNPRALRAAGTAMVLDITVGATQYNRVKTKMDKFTITEVAGAETDGMLDDVITGVVSPEGTEDYAILYD